MNHLRQVFTLFLLSLTCHAYTQAPSTHFHFIGPEEGLSDYRHNAFIYKDQMGFYWISSETGFFRMDGSFIKSYPSSLFGPYSKNIQSSFFEDRQNDLWFTTYDALHRYSRQADTLESVQLSRDTQLLSSDYHLFYIDTAQQHIWLQVGQYMVSYDLVKRKICSPFLATSGRRFQVIANEQGHPIKILAFPWFNKTGIEVWSKENGEWRLENQEKGILGKTKFSKGFLIQDSVLWLVSPIGLIAYHLKRQQLLKIYTPNQKTSYPFGDGVLYRNRYLILTSSLKSEGLWVFDCQEKKFIDNWQASQQAGSLSTNAPGAIMLDRDQNLWVMHAGKGLDFTSLQSHNFDNPLDCLPSTDRVKSILEDSQSQIWVLTKNKGVLVFDLEGNLQQHFPKIGEHSFFAKAHLSMDQADRCWLVINNQIYCFDSSIQEWQLVYQENGENQLLAIYHGFGDPILVSGTSGVQALRQQKDQWQLEPLELFSPYQQYEFDFFLKIDTNRALAPFNAHQVWQISKQQDQLIHSRTINLQSESYTALESKGILWIGGEKGLFRIEGEEISQVVLGKSPANGQPSVFSIQEDQAQRLWLATDQGIWCHHPDSMQQIQYREGLSSILFSAGTGWKATDGKIWLGNEKGLTVFSPDTLKLNTSPIRSYIEKIWINNQAFKAEQNVNALELLQLQYYENTLDFELRNLTSISAYPTQIRFRLKNYDDRWSIIKNGEPARFTQIPPGRYTLEVVGIDQHQQMGQLKSLAVWIQIPFWKTEGFKLLAFLFVLSLMLLIILIYYQRQLRKQRQLLEKQALIHRERNRIAQELHDDMGGNLSSILFISEDLAFEENRKEQKTQVNRITQLTRNALLNMKDIIWALDNQQSSTEDLFNRLKTYATEVMQDHKLSLKIAAQIDPEYPVIISSEKKRNTVLIFKECLHNIVKHAAAQEVNIKFAQSGTSINIEIHDDGKAFDLTTKNKGMGLKNMHTRAAAIGGNIRIQSEPSLGTSIRFHLSCN